MRHLLCCRPPRNSSSSGGGSSSSTSSSTGSSSSYWPLLLLLQLVPLLQLLLLLLLVLERVSPLLLGIRFLPPLVIGRGVVGICGAARRNALFATRSCPMLQRCGRLCNV